MANKVTLKHVAKLAGVGTASVERVLNGRGGVRPALVEKVIAAALKLDYPKRLPTRHHGILQIELLTLQPELTFTIRLVKSFERIGASLDRSIVIHRTILKGFDPELIAAHLLKPESRRSALIVAMPQHPLIRDAILKLQKNGLPIVQIISRMDQINVPFVGIDNVAAGRTVVQMMMALQPRSGTIAAICHSQFFSVHRERLQGFSEFMARQTNGRFMFKQVEFTFDNADEIGNAAMRLIGDHPDLAGLYAVGGDYGPLCAVLARQDAQRSICCIGHEITKQTTKALEQGIISAVIDQVPETQARRALDMVLHMLGILKIDVDTSPIRFVTVTAENL